MSLESVANLIIQYIVGGAAAYFGFVTEEDVRGFARPMNLLLVPSLIFASLGQGVSYEVLISEGGWTLEKLHHLASKC